MEESKVSVRTAAKIFGKSQNWVRAGIIEGWLPIGIAVRKGMEVHSIKEQKAGLGRINYYISKKKLEEMLGHKVEEEEK